MAKKPIFRLEKDGPDFVVAWDTHDEQTGKLLGTTKTQPQREVIARTLAQALNSEEATTMTSLVLLMCYNRKFITDNVQELPHTTGL